MRLPKGQAPFPPPEMRTSVERLGTERNFKVGDLVSRDGTDVQRVVEVDDDCFCITVECIKEPLGCLNEDGTRDPPWCRTGEREYNLARRYDYAGDILDVAAVVIGGELSAPSDAILLVCKSCGRHKGYDRAADASISPSVVRIEQDHCDRDWNGEREGETWFDRDGKIVQQSAAGNSKSKDEVPR